MCLLPDCAGGHPMRKEGLLILLVLCIHATGLIAQDQKSLQRDPGSYVMELVRKARSVEAEQYVELRREFLKYVSEHPAWSETASVKDRHHWKEKVILQAWAAWSKDTEKCGTLWRFEPPMCGLRNPHPFWMAEAKTFFEQHDETGYAIALELMLAINEVHSGGLVLLITEKHSDLAFEVLLECASRNYHHTFAIALESYGPKAGPRILSKLKSSDPGKCRAIIFALGMLKHRPAVPELGRILISVPKDAYNRPYDPDYYGARDSDTARAVIYAIEEITGQTIPGPEKGTSVLERNTRTIDAAKEWWQKTGSKIYRTDEGNPGFSDVSSN